VGKRKDVIAGALCFAIKLASHLTYEFLSQGDFFYPASYTYLTPALNVLHGNGFTSEDGPETLRTPGYPAFLLPFLALHASPGIIVFANHLIDALLAVAIYVLARRNGSRRWIAIAASLILAFDTITIHYANKILTETLSAAFIFAIFVIVLHRRTMSWLVIAGLLCGVLVLVRPVAIVYFVVVMAWLAWMGVRPALVMSFIASAILLPASSRPLGRSSRP